MKDEELLLSISKMMDEKFNPFEKRMDSMEKDLKQEIRLMKEEVKLVKGEVKLVDNKVSLINLKLENVFEPRMSTIESCYMETYKRYKNGVDKIEKLESDNELIRSILQRHSKILQCQTA